jgi:hypothetical protein
MERPESIVQEAEPMQTRKVLFVAALFLGFAPGCSLFDPPEVRMAKAMRRQTETMQQVADEFDKGIKEREQRGRE